MNAASSWPLNCPQDPLGARRIFIPMSIQRAQILIEQERYEDAVDFLLSALEASPRDALVLTLLASCQAELENFDAAEESIQEAISSDPTYDFARYIEGLIQMERGYPKTAILSYKSALELNPMCALYYGQLAVALAVLKEWQQALEQSVKGLEIDPSCSVCLHARARALTGMGRAAEASDALLRQLSEQPEDALIHANLGWLALEKNKPKEALAHFETALAIDPEAEWARAGLLEALRARYLFYRIIMGYFLWMSKFKEGSQWAIILGIYFLLKWLRQVGQTNPSVSPLITPILVFFFAFVYLSWTGPSVTNLLLRLSGYGKHLLNEEETRNSTLSGIIWLSALLCFGGNFIYGGLWMLGIVLLYLGILISADLNTEKGWPKTTLRSITLIMSILGLGGFSLILADFEIGVYLAKLFAGLALLMLIAANFLVTATVKR